MSKVIALTPRRSAPCPAVLARLLREAVTAVQHLEALQAKRAAAQATAYQKSRESYWAVSPILRLNKKPSEPTSDGKIAMAQEAAEAALAAAAKYGWGVEKGKRYRVTAQEDTVELCVDLLYPVVQEGALLLACSGSTLTGRGLYLLGRDNLTLVPLSG